MASLLCLILAVLFLTSTGAAAQTSGYGGASLPVVTGLTNQPNYIAFDGAGNMYLMQLSASNVLELTAASGYQTQVQIGSGIVNSWAIAVNSAGNTVYVSSVNGPVYKIDVPSNTTTTLSSAFANPNGLAVDSSGNLFVADVGGSAVSIWEFAGGSATPTQIYSGSDIDDVYGMAVDAAGDLFVTDGLSGIAELANNSGTYGAPTVVTPQSGTFEVPFGVTVDSANNLYFTDGNENLFEAPFTGSGWGSVSRIVRDFYGRGLAFNPAGQLYVASSASQAVYRVFTSSLDFGTVAVGSASATSKLTFQWTSPTTLGTPPYKVLTMGFEGGDFVDVNDHNSVCYAGNTYSTYDQYCFVDVQFQPTHPGLQRGAVVLKDDTGNVVATAYVYGVGKGSQAVFTTPSQTLNITGLSTVRGISVDGSGNLYAFETGSGAVDKIAPGSTTPTLLDTLTSSPNAGGATAVDGAGNLFVLDGAAGEIYEYPGGAGPAVQVAAVPESDDNLAIDGAGNLYFSGATTGAIYKLPLGGSVTTVLPGNQGHRFVGMALDAAGDIFAADFNNDILYEVAAGTSTLSAVVTGGDLAQPHAVAVDPAGNIYVTNYLGTNVIFYAAGTYASQLLPETGQTGIALDSAGNLYTITGTDTISSYTRALGSSPAPSLRFTSVAQGGTSPDSPKTVSLTDIGNASLNFTSITYPTDFPVNSSDSSLCAVGTPVAIDAVCDISMSFTPQSVGTFSDDVAIQSDGGNGDVSLSGTGSAKPQVIVTPSTLTFGNQTQGTTSQTWHVDVKNNSTSSPLDNVLPTLLQTQPAGGSNFAIVNNTCTGTPGHAITIAPNTSCGMDITFTPSVTQNLTDNYAATLSISDDGLQSPQTVPITGVGTGINAFLAPSVLNFTQYPGSGATASQSVTLDNASNGPLTIGTITTGTSYFQITGGTCQNGGTVAPNSSCSILVTFNPDMVRSYTDTLTVTDNATGGSQSIPLNGTGQGINAVLTPSSLNFTQQVGVISATQLLTLSNPSQGTLSITSLVVSGSGFAAATGGTCAIPGTLAANTSCTIPITFTPPSVGSISGSVTVAESNSIGGSQTSTLTGKGVYATATLTNNPLDFGPVSELTTVTQTATLRNTSDYTLNITGTPQVSGTSFSLIATTCGATLAAQSQCTITVQFAPTTAIAYTGSLTVLADVAGGQVSVPITGTGMAPIVSISPSSLDYGNVTLGTNSSAKTVTITNQSLGPVNFTSFATTANFTLDSHTTTCNSSTPLTGGASCNVGVIFSPSNGTSSQPYSGSLTISDNASGGTQTIALNGTGSLAPSYSMSVNPQSLTIHQGSSGQVTFTMTPTGGFSGTVNLACNNLPASVACSFAPSALVADGSNKVVTSQLTITTGSAQTAGLPARPGSTRLAGFLLFPALLLGGLLAWRRRQFSARVRWMALLLLGIAITSSFIGCGSVQNTAAPGTSSVTVTASTTASSGGGQTSQSVSFTLTIVQ